MATAILLKLKDRRNFLTFCKNLPLLEDFTKTFNAIVSLVKIEKDNSEILELEELAIAICNGTNQGVSGKYEIIEQLIPNKAKSNITKEIRTALLANSVVSLQELREKHKNITTANLSSIYSQVRKKLILEGYSLNKVGPGNYKLNK